MKIIILYFFFHLKNTKKIERKKEESLCSSHHYYHHRVELKLIWICSFPPFKQEANSISGSRDPRRLVLGSERREGPAFLLFRKAIRSSDSSPLVRWGFFGDRRDENPQSKKSRLPFLEERGDHSRDQTRFRPAEVSVAEFFFETPSTLRDKWATHGVDIFSLRLHYSACSLLLRRTHIFANV